VGPGEGGRSTKCGKTFVGREGERAKEGEASGPRFRAKTEKMLLEAVAVAMSTIRDCLAASGAPGKLVGLVGISELSVENIKSEAQETGDNGQLPNSKPGTASMVIAESGTGAVENHWGVELG